MTDAVRAAARSRGGREQPVDRTHGAHCGTANRYVFGICTRVRSFTPMISNAPARPGRRAEHPARTRACLISEHAMT